MHWDLQELGNSFARTSNLTPKYVAVLNAWNYLSSQKEQFQNQGTEIQQKYDSWTIRAKYEERLRQRFAVENYYGFTWAFITHKGYGQGRIWPFLGYVSGTYSWFNGEYFLNDWISLFVLILKNQRE